MKLTKGEFGELIKIQKLFYTKAKALEQEKFDKLIQSLNDDEKVLANETFRALEGNLDKKAKDWIDFELIEDGFESYKQIYFNGYFSALIPVLIIEYNRKNIPASWIQTKSQTGKGLSEKLIEKYPQLKETLKNHNKCYKDMLMAINNANLSDKAGYRTDIDNVEEWKGFSKSIIKDIYSTIRKIYKQKKPKMISPQKIEEIKKITDLETKMFTQGEIAEKIGKSQPYVSKILQQRDKIIREKHLKGKI